MKKFIDTLVGLAVCGLCFYGFLYLIGQLLEFVL